MRTTESMTETERLHRLSENLMSQLGKGREWATPGVQAALQRAVAGLDTGIETASPRLQALLRRLANELAGSVETLTPQVQERLRRVGPKAAPVPVPPVRSASKAWWLILGLVALAAGAAMWRSAQSSTEKSAPSVSGEEASSADPNLDADLAAGRI
ncbi:hypothetical protein [Pseudarthrobacter sp. NamE5]|uniref:hypothetical protein n=1 Tax=Pseudarthrobacter sp. NamE5 TaxID=2576839 RepID=UPI00110B12C1|nr:hypothetical protein [Pseudarthrobacter sp. NamE5]TLM87586.1 hypothetical protein FDW84_03070 [Pseudarthrobacter sp. NamE5]